MGLPTPNDQATCLVTGASAGIGADFARCLARRGLGVTVVARRKDRLDQLVAELERDHGIRAQALSVDLTDAEARKKLVSDVEALGLKVDVLVNNAGFGTRGHFHELDPERELDEISLNVEALVDLSRAFLPSMVERDCGGIINVASTAAFQPVPYMATYGATKAFVLSFSEALSCELEGTNVAVTAIHPGPVETEFPGIAGNTEEFEKMPAFARQSPDKVAEIAVKAFSKGKRGVIPGALYNVMIYTTRPMPTVFKLPIMRRMFAPK